MILTVVLFSVRFLFTAAPIFSQEMVDCETCEGSGVMFQVKVEGAEDVTWQCEGENIDFDAEKRFTSEEEDDGVYKLLISEVDVDDTDTTYQCTAKNAAGQTIVEASIFVEEMPENVKDLINKKEHKS